MQLVICVLNRTESRYPAENGWSKRASGATILDSTGLLRALRIRRSPVFGVLAGSSIRNGSTADHSDRSGEKAGRGDPNVVNEVTGG
jgi:hypothetical protein